MSNRKIDIVDTTVQKTYEWLGELRDELHMEDSQVAYHALKAVLHCLRDRLSVEDAAGLGAQLPTLVRGIYYDSWHPAHKPLKIRDRDEFLELVSERFGNIGVVQPERLVQVVLAVLEKHVSQGEVQKIQQSLPKPIRDLWPMAA